MERQRAKARASWAGSGDAATEAVWFALRETSGPTEFLGYETENAEGVAVALVKDGKAALPPCRPAKTAPSFSIRRHSMPNPAARSETPA